MPLISGVSTDMSNTVRGSAIRPTHTIPRKLLGDAVRDRLRDEILRGEVKPGERLGELETARRMGTSQGPVRAALSQLAQEGLLINLPHRGTYVSSISEQDARLAYEIRAVIEPIAAEMAVFRLQRDDFDALRGDIRQMQAAARSGDVGEMVAHDMAFHGRIYSASGSNLLTMLWVHVEGQVRMFAAAATAMVYDDLEGSADSHIKLLAQFQHADLDVLSIAVRDHLGSLWRKFDDESMNGAEAITAPSSTS